MLFFYFIFIVICYCSTTPPQSPPQSILHSRPQSPLQLLPQSPPPTSSLSRKRTFIDTSLIYHVIPVKDKFPRVSITPNIEKIMFVNFDLTKDLPYFPELRPKKMRLIIVNTDNHDLIPIADGGLMTAYNPYRNRSLDDIYSYLLEKGISGNYSVLLVAFDIFIDSGIPKVFLSSPLTVYSFCSNCQTIKKFKGKMIKIRLNYDWEPSLF